MSSRARCVQTPGSLCFRTTHELEKAMKPPFELGLLLRGTLLWPAEKIIVLGKGHAPDVQVFGTESSRPQAGYILLCAQ